MRVNAIRLWPLVAVTTLLTESYTGFTLRALISNVVNRIWTPAATTKLANTIRYEMLFLRALESRHKSA